MQFYRYMGTANMAEGNDGSGKIFPISTTRIKNKAIAIKISEFNQKFKWNKYFYIASVQNDTVSVGIISNSKDSPRSLIPSFLDAVGFEPCGTDPEEVTFGTAKTMLDHAEGNGYIEDEDEILKRFKLERLSSRSWDRLAYGESIIRTENKRHIYSEAKRLSARDTLIPELDRIYAGNAKTGAFGHPVHYMIETDDHDTRNGIYGLLLQALYANGRIRNKRYAFADFKPGKSFPAADYDCLYSSCDGGTVIVRYLADDVEEDDQASSSLDIIENICETMKKYRNRVLTVFCLPRECTESKKQFFENLGNTSFIEFREEPVTGKKAEAVLRKMAGENGVRADRSLLSMIEDDRGYIESELRELFNGWYNEKLKTDIFPQYGDIAAVRSEIRKSVPKGSAYSELMAMVGLDDAKKVINRALDYYKAQRLFADKGMKAENVSMHMVFTGNPGTAKTTVARLFARIMRDNGLLSKGGLIEVGRGDLVGKYVGWTAQIIKKKFNEARGNVLFIDEAYSLVDDRDGSFGDEAINTIVQEMENHRGDVVVIFAGYPDRMESFLGKNPGLRSRIAFHVHFSDYSTDELCGMARLMAGKNGLRLTDDACEKLGSIFECAKAKADFGNGRFVRNTLEKAKMAQASRLLAMDYDLVNASDVSTICADDIEIPFTACGQNTVRIGF